MSLSKDKSTSTSDIKILEYVAKLVKNDVNVIDGGRELILRKVGKIVLKPTIWLVDSCNMCGRCCPNKGNAYLETEYDRLLNPDKAIYDEYGLDFSKHRELIDKLEKKTFIINDNEKVFYYIPPVPHKQCYINSTEGRNLNSCPWVLPKDNDVVHCSIHPYRGYTCRFPHIRMWSANNDINSTSIGLREFGRNWALKCYAQFGLEYNDDALAARIQFLRDFNRDIQYLEIPTWLPEIINTMQNILDKGIIPNHDIIIEKTHQRKLF